MDVFYFILVIIFKLLNMVLGLNRWVSSKAVVVVTGTSSGIGAAIAKLLVKEGLTVVGIARRVERTKELAKILTKEKGKLIPLKADIGVEREVVQAFEWIKKNVGPTHILINNAALLGSDKTGGLIEGSYENWKKKFDVNVLGLSVATQEAVRQMRENHINGHIINLNSIAGHQVPNYPNMGTYSASKFAVTALAEALRHELREAKTKIKITSISPGLVETEMTTLDPNLPEALKGLLQGNPLLKAEDIAEAVYYVLSTPEHVQIQELTIKPVGEPY